MGSPGLGADKPLPYRHTTVEGKEIASPRDPSLGLGTPRNDSVVQEGGVPCGLPRIGRGQAPPLREMGSRESEIWAATTGGAREKEFAPE